MKKYTRLTLEKRCQIFALLENSLSIPKIASLLGVHKTTIYREVKRNSLPAGRVRYDPVRANRKAKKRFARCRRKPKIEGALRELVIEKLSLLWSPQQISGRIKHEHRGSLCHETIYRFTRKNRKYRRYLKFVGKRGARRYRQRKRRNQLFTSIRERPSSAENRTRFGHWERDGMYGANGKQLLICVDRKSRYTKIGTMLYANSAYVGKLTEKLLAFTKKKVLSITNDNGSEFRKPMQWDVPVYYCDPYKPQQRGTVEHTIGMIRSFVSRKTDLEGLGEQGIMRLEQMMNEKPRKILGYRTPYEVFYGKKVALVSGI